MQESYQPADDPQDDDCEGRTLFSFACEARQLTALGYNRDQLIAELDRALAPDQEPVDVPMGYDPFKAA